MDYEYPIDLNVNKKPNQIQSDPDFKTYFPIVYQTMVDLKQFLAKNRDKNGNYHEMAEYQFYGIFNPKKYEI